MIAAILAIIGAIESALPTIIAAGADIAPLISAVTTMLGQSGAPTPTQQAAVDAAVKSLQDQFSAGVTALGQAAPNS